MLNNLNTISRKINCEQALDDIDRLNSLIQEKYAGYEFYSKNFEKTYIELNKKYKYLKRNEYINTNLFYDDLINAYDFIKDGHFCFCKMAPNGIIEISRMHNHYNMYFSDVFLQKKNHLYILHTDDKEYFLTEESISQMCDKKIFLLFYPSKGCDLYQIGILSQEKLNEINLCFDGDVKTISLHMDNSIDYHFEVTENNNLKPYINTKESDKSIYIACNTFSFYDKENVKKINKIIEDLEFNDKKNIILDFRGNQGGYLKYPLKLLSTILFKEKKVRYKFIKENIKEDIRIVSFLGCNKKIVKKNKNINFICDTKSNLFILVDQNTVSAAERVIPILKKIDNLDYKIIGTNTAGVLKSADSYKYKLDNSNIYVCIPKAFQKDISCEEYGIFPDVWAKKDDILNTLVLYTEDYELNNLLKNINYQLE